MSQNDRTQLIPDPQQPNRPAGGVQSPRPIAPNHGKQRGASNASRRPGQQHQQHTANGNAPRQAPSHARADRGSNQKPSSSKKLGGKTTLFVVLGLIVIVYIVGVVAFSQVATPTPPLPAWISRSQAPRLPPPRSTRHGSTTSSPYRATILAGPTSPNPISHRRR